MDELALFVLDGKRLPVRLANRLTGDEAFEMFETIVVEGGRLKGEEINVFLSRPIDAYVDEFGTRAETMVFKP